jgi:hypothetical protein
LVSSGVLPSCTSLNRWPKEAFTGSGIAEMSSLLLAIHTTGFGGKVGETSISGSGGALLVFSAIEINMEKFPYFVKADLGPCPPTPQSATLTGYPARNLAHAAPPPLTANWPKPTKSRHKPD